MMKKEHLSHYIPLVAILAAGIYGYSYFSFDANFQAAIVLAVSLAYIAWGVVHHIVHRDFSFEVFFEYLTIAGLGLAILLSIIFWS